MFVAATSRCFPDLPLEAALHRLVDLEYSYVELMLHETDGHIKPSEILADLERAVMLCRQTHRLTVAAFSVELDTPDEGLYYRQFAAICKLAKATKVVTLTVRSSELGTPFNAEIERLRAMVAIATNESVRVGLLTESRPHDAGSRHGRRLLRQREGPGHHARSEPLRLRPASRRELRAADEARLSRPAPRHEQIELQVRVGQGEVEYGRLVNQLAKVRYDRALCVDIIPQPDVDQMAEMRKMRLLLESLL